MNAFSLFKKKDESGATEETSSASLFGRADLLNDIQAVADVKAAYENAKSKFSSADTEMIKYSTDQKAFAAANKNNDVSMIPLICSIIALNAKCFDTASKAFGLIKEGLDKIKSLGKKRDNTKEVAAAKAIEQGVLLLQSMKVFRIALNSSMSVAIQLSANIKSADDERKANSRIFRTVHGNDIQKQVKTLEALNEGKKKLLSKDLKGMVEAAENCKTALGYLTGGIEEMQRLINSAINSTEDLIVIGGNALEFVSAVSEAVCATKQNQLECVKRLTALHEKCISDHSASTKSD
ncbi:hypothetical protein FACS1894122_09980 [Alphaproteobacteria bacterium]|nr:hypothetical protein FACS1894122_09980 [Alphaproteobacteria bacterium]